MDPLQIAPEPDEAEREAILEALAADETEPPPAASEWSAALLPSRDGESDEP